MQEQMEKFSQNKQGFVAKKTNLLGFITTKP